MVSASVLHAVCSSTVRSRSAMANPVTGSVTHACNVYTLSYMQYNFNCAACFVYASLCYLTVTLISLVELMVLMYSRHILIRPFIQTADETVTTPLQVLY